MTSEMPLLPEMRVLASIWRRKLFILLAVVLASMTGCFAARVETPVYRAESSMIFRFGREYQPRDLAVEGWVGEPMRIEMDTAMQTDLEILGSHRMIGLALEKAGDPPNVDGDRYAAIAPSLIGRSEALRRSLSIRRTEGTNLVRISYENGDPDYALHFLKTLIDTFMSERRALLTWNRVEDLEAPVEALRAAFAEAEKNEADFRIENALYDIGAVRQQLLDRLAAIDAASAQSATTDASPGTADDGEDRRLVKDALAELSRKEITLANLSAEVERARAQYDKARAVLDEQRLSASFAEALASPIFVLDQPELRPDPIGLSTVTGGVMGGLVGLALGLVAALWLERKAFFARPARPAGAPAPTPPAAQQKPRRGR